MSAPSLEHLFCTRCICCNKVFDDPDALDRHTIVCGNQPHGNKAATRRSRVEQSTDLYPASRRGSSCRAAGTPERDVVHVPRPIKVKEPALASARRRSCSDVDGGHQPVSFSGWESTLLELERMQAENRSRLESSRLRGSVERSPPPPTASSQRNSNSLLKYVSESRGSYSPLSRSGDAHLQDDGAALTFRGCSPAPLEARHEAPLLETSPKSGRSLTLPGSGNRPVSRPPPSAAELSSSGRRASHPLTQPITVAAAMRTSASLLGQPRPGERLRDVQGSAALPPRASPPSRTWSQGTALAATRTSSENTQRSTAPPNSTRNPTASKSRPSSQLIPTPRPAATPRATAGHDPPSRPAETPSKRAAASSSTASPAARPLATPRQAPGSSTPSATKTLATPRPAATPRATAGHDPPSRPAETPSKRAAASSSTASPAARPLATPRRAPGSSTPSATKTLATPRPAATPRATAPPCGSSSGQARRHAGGADTTSTSTAPIAAAVIATRQKTDTQRSACEKVAGRSPSPAGPVLCTTGPPSAGSTPLPDNSKEESQQQPSRLPLRFGSRHRSWDEGFKEEHHCDPTTITAAVPPALPRPYREVGLSSPPAVRTDQAKTKAGTGVGCRLVGTPKVRVGPSYASMHASARAAGSTATPLRGRGPSDPSRAQGLGLDRSSSGSATQQGVSKVAPGPQQKIVFCTDCGQRYSNEKAKFCGYCGHRR